MKFNWPRLLKDNQFQLALAGVIGAILLEAGMDIDTPTILVILSPLLVYVGTAGPAPASKD